MIVDPNGQHRDLCRVFATKFSQIERPLSNRPASMSICYMPDETVTEKEAKAGKTVVNKHFDDLCYMIFEMRDVTIFVEELDEFVTANYIPPGFQKCVKRGRHRGVRVLWGSQRAADIHRKVTSQTEDHYLGAQHEARDKQYIKECFGETAKKVALLRRREFVHWFDGDELGAVTLKKENGVWSFHPVSLEGRVEGVPVGEEAAA